MDFEDRFGQALRDAGQGYHFDPVTSQPLLQRALRRGRGKQTRRIAAAFLGAGVATALAVGGLSLSASSAPGPSREVSSSQGVSGQHILDLLEGMLPHGTVSRATAVGAGGGRPRMEPPRATLVYDDGHGAGQVSLTFTQTGEKDVLGFGTCSTPPPKGFTCTIRKLPDRSVLSFATEPFGGKVRLWTATLVTDRGDVLTAQELNNPSGLPSDQATRPAPPLTEQQLTGIVADPAWTPVMHAARVAQKAKDGQPTQAEVLAVARSLRPAGVQFGWNEATNQEGSAGFQVRVAGRPAGQFSDLTLSVARWPGEARSEEAALFPAGTTRLPDGTLLYVYQEKQTSRTTTPSSDQRVRVLRPDGVVVYLVLDNSATGTGHGKVPDPMPALTVDQLRTMAMSPLWEKIGR